MIQTLLSEGLNDLISFPVPQRFANKQHDPYQDIKTRKGQNHRLDPSSLRQNDPSGENPKLEDVHLIRTTHKRETALQNIAPAVQLRRVIPPNFFQSDELALLASLVHALDRLSQ